MVEKTQNPATLTLSRLFHQVLHIDKALMGCKTHDTPAAAFVSAVLYNHSENAALKNDKDTNYVG